MVPGPTCQKSPAAGGPTEGNSRRLRSAPRSSRRPRPPGLFWRRYPWPPWQDIDWSDPYRGGDARCFQDIPDDGHGHHMGRMHRAAVPFGLVLRLFFIELQIRGTVDEDLIDGVDMDIFRSRVAQVDGVDSGGDTLIFRHAGDRSLVVDLCVVPALVPADRLLCLKQAGAAGNTDGFQGRTDSQGRIVWSVLDASATRRFALSGSIRGTHIPRTRRRISYRSQYRFSESPEPRIFQSLSRSLQTGRRCQQLSSKTPPLLLLEDDSHGHPCIEAISWSGC